MPRTARRYAVHLILSNGQREMVHFPTIDDFQQWYGGVLNAAGGETFVNVPIREFEGEYLVVRPSAVIAIRVEPEFQASDE
jgi:hypothetical protein